MNNHTYDWKTFISAWAQKVFTIAVSIKVLFLATIVVLCVLKYISGGQFITGFTVVLGLREIYKISNVVRNGNNNGNGGK